MSCTLQTGLYKKQTKKQIIAIAFLICFVSVSLLFRAFILTHSDHVHTHNDADGSCVTCAQIQNAENVLKLLKTAATLGFTLFAGYYAVITLVKVTCSDIINLTPITAKTRMDN